MTGWELVVAGLVATAAALVLPPAPGRRRMDRLGPLTTGGVRAGGARWRVGSVMGAIAPEKLPSPSDSVDLALELIAVGLLAGQPLDAALASVGSAMPGPLGPGLASVASALRLGLPAERAWGALGPDSAHLPEIGRLLARVSDGGVPAARLLNGKAAALRAASQARALATARRVGVLAVFPLVVCLLPAFGLLCVAPAVLTALPAWGA